MATPTIKLESPGPARIKQEKPEENAVRVPLKNPGGASEAQTPRLPTGCQQEQVKQEPLDHQLFLPHPVQPGNPNTAVDASPGTVNTAIRIKRENCGDELPTSVTVVEKENAGTAPLPPIEPVEQEDNTSQPPAKKAKMDTDHPIAENLEQVVADPQPMTEESASQRQVPDGDDVLIDFVKKEPEDIIRDQPVRIVSGNHELVTTRRDIQALLPDTGYFCSGSNDGSSYQIKLPENVKPLASHRLLLIALNPDVPFDCTSTDSVTGVTLEELRKAAEYFKIDAEKIGFHPAPFSDEGVHASSVPEPDISQPTASVGDLPNPPESAAPEAAAADVVSNTAPIVSLDGIPDKFFSYQNTPEFLELSLEQILTLLKSDFLRVPSEMDLYQAVMKWCRHRSPERCTEEVLTALLAEIRWDLLLDALPMAISMAEGALHTVLTNLQTFLLPKPRVLTAMPRQRHISDTVYLFFADRNQVALHRYDWRANNLHDVALPVDVTPWSTYKEFGPLIGSSLWFRVERKDRLVTYLFSPTTREVQRILDEPLTMTELCPTVHLNGMLYRWDFQNPREKNNSCIYDMEFESLDKEVALPKKVRKDAAFDCHEGKFYYCGGVSVNGKNLRPVATVEVFDAKSGKWRSLPDMRHARKCFAVKVYNGYLYATGGVQIHDADTEILHSCERLQLGVKGATWERMSPLRDRRYQHAMFVANSQLYVCGGYLYDGDQACDMERYDMATGRWKAFDKQDKFIFEAFSHCAVMVESYAD
ncbi:uncharacterized protein LOC129586509 [Paramacrobiotus metropolitanus]|uniref:uncharacterized protein LOC129586509 n=1 Tax=Paramacrobiotus metropolitanus TaxID=2943436 RepID=UPI0024460131|nr:uncharacterized protein LOC129586509 [Paramacrobiotus metropolitanus]XP_055335755.1 uncharacterized protein LOC129586509 [Paramacrobiotus metropolitanus]XP_055335756.1 uncharacterized protein LOC129586509 [Paramacrobiotus metropolitanus]